MPSLTPAALRTNILQEIERNTETLKKTSDPAAAKQLHDHMHKMLNNKEAGFGTAADTHKTKITQAYDASPAVQKTTSTGATHLGSIPEAPPQPISSSPKSKTTSRVAKKGVSPNDTPGLEDVLKELTTRLVKLKATPAKAATAPGGSADGDNLFRNAKWKGKNVVKNLESSLSGVSEKREFKPVDQIETAGIAAGSSSAPVFQVTTSPPNSPKGALTSVNFLPVPKVRSKVPTSSVNFLPVPKVRSKVPTSSGNGLANGLPAAKPPVAARTGAASPKSK